MTVPTYWLAAAMALACFAALALARLSWRLPGFPGQRSQLLSLLSIAWWTAMVTIEHLSAETADKMFWAEMAWLGIVGTPAYWGLFVWNYISGQDHRGWRAAERAVFGVALAVTAVALTNDYHHLIYVSAVPVGVPPAVTLNYSHGRGYTGLIFGFGVIMLAADLAILGAILRANRIYRRHYVALLLISLPPWITNSLYAAALFKVGGADVTPLSFMLTDAILYWLLSRRYMSDLLPIAQGLLLGAIPDPVLVLDSARRIAECNPAARRLAGEKPLIGLRLDQVPALGNAAEAIFRPDPAGPREVAIGFPPRYFDVGDVSLAYAGREVGRLLLLREITHRKEAEFRLQAALAELERQLQQNLALQQQLREQAIRDGLTGLHNRRLFDELAPVMLSDAERTVSPLALAMIDIDHFKRLNDGFGHQAGDAMLRRIGAFLRLAVRQGDMVFRMGGEEFLILLPHAAGDAALQRLDEWRRRFAEETVEHDGQRLTASFSAGLALFPQDAGNLTELLQRADFALYQAKSEGRNRVARWQG